MSGICRREEKTTTDNRRKESLQNLPELNRKTKIHYSSNHNRACYRDPTARGTCMRPRRPIDVITDSYVAFLASSGSKILIRAIVKCPRRGGIGRTEPNFELPAAAVTICLPRVSKSFVGETNGFLL